MRYLGANMLRIRKLLFHDMNCVRGCANSTEFYSIIRRQQFCNTSRVFSIARLHSYHSLLSNEISTIQSAVVYQQKRYYPRKRRLSNREQMAFLADLENADSDLQTNENFDNFEPDVRFEEISSLIKQRFKGKQSSEEEAGALEVNKTEKEVFYAGEKLARSESRDLVMEQMGSNIIHVDTDAGEPIYSPRQHFYLEIKEYSPVEVLSAIAERFEEMDSTHFALCLKQLHKYYEKLAFAFPEDAETYKRKLHNNICFKLLVAGVLSRAKTYDATITCDMMRFLQDLGYEIPGTELYILCELLRYQIKDLHLDQLLDLYSRLESYTGIISAKRVWAGCRELIPTKLDKIPSLTLAETLTFLEINQTRSWQREFHKKLFESLCRKMLEFDTYGVEQDLPRLARILQQGSPKILFRGNMFMDLLARLVIDETRNFVFSEELPLATAFTLIKGIQPIKSVSLDLQAWYVELLEEFANKYLNSLLQARTEDTQSQRWDLQDLLWDNSILNVRLLESLIVDFISNKWYFMDKYYHLGILNLMVYECLPHLKEELGEEKLIQFGDKSKEEAKANEINELSEATYLKFVARQKIEETYDLRRQLYSVAYQLSHPLREKPMHQKQRFHARDLPDVYFPHDKLENVVEQLRGVMAKSPVLIRKDDGGFDFVDYFIKLDSGERAVVYVLRDRDYFLNKGILKESTRHAINNLSHFHDFGIILVQSLHLKTLTDPEQWLTTLLHECPVKVTKKVKNDTPTDDSESTKRYPLAEFEQNLMVFKAQNIEETEKRLERFREIFGSNEQEEDYELFDESFYEELETRHMQNTLGE